MVVRYIDNRINPAYYKNCIEAFEVINRRRGEIKSGRLLWTIRKTDKAFRFPSLDIIHFEHLSRLIKEDKSKLSKYLLVPLSNPTKIYEDMYELKAIRVNNHTLLETTIQKDKEKFEKVVVIPRNIYEFSKKDVEEGAGFITSSLGYNENTNAYSTGEVLIQVKRYTKDEIKKFSEDEKKLWEKYLKKHPPKQTLLEKLMNNDALKPLSIEEDGFYIDKNIWYLLLVYLINQKQVLLVGDSGTGKTELVFYLAERLKKASKALKIPSKKLDVFDMAVSNAEASFKGSPAINEKGYSEFRYSRFAQTIQEKNRLILLDEMNRGDLHAQNMLMPLFDKRRTLYVERAQNQELNVGENTVFWATANIGMQFSGTEMIDAAVMQRFERVEITYPPKEKEEKILQVREKISKVASVKIVDFANACRTNIHLDKNPSTRMLLKAANLVSCGYSVAQACEFAIVNQYETDSIDGGERKVAKTILQRL